MKIIVTAKQVPDTNEVKIDPVKGTLIREGVPSILNPDDANALEAALQLKDRTPGSTVTVVSMGPNQALVMLHECIAMGADDAVLLSSRAFGGADTCATPPPSPPASRSWATMTSPSPAVRPSTAIPLRWPPRWPCASVCLW